MADLLTRWAEWFYYENHRNTWGTDKANAEILLRQSLGMYTFWE